MTVDTKGLLKGDVSHIEIIEFLKKKFNTENITHDIVKYPTFTKFYLKPIYHGCIQIETKNEHRSMFYISGKPKDESYTEVDDGEYTYISLGHNELAEEIIESIVTEFGGYIDYNDCDDEGFIPVAKEGRFKPIRRVTMKEIYEKFGEVVIITDK